MAKRFTDTDKYKKPFIRGLQGAYKVLWDYLYHDCDHAGIWIVDFEIAQIYVGGDLPINRVDALSFFNSGKQRVIEVDHGKKWFLPSFIEFQYGNLNPDNRAHNSVINILKKYGLWNCDKGLVSPLQGCKDKDMDKDMEKDKDKEIIQSDLFPVERKVKKFNPASIVPFFDDTEFKDAWDSWKSVLTKKKCSFSERAVKARLNKLMKLSSGNKSTAIKILDKSSFGGWSDLYELSEPDKNENGVRRI